METLSSLLAICERNHRSNMDSLHKGLVMRGYRVSLLLDWTVEQTIKLPMIWDPRCSYDITVMTLIRILSSLYCMQQCVMGLLPDTQNCGLCMRWECRERFHHHRLQRKPLVSDPGSHHGTCVTHVPWCMSGSLTRGGGENVPGIPGACATHNFVCLIRGPCKTVL